MEENFEEIIEVIKNTIMDPKETKKYILAIKKVLKKGYESCREEQDDDEILKDYLDSYASDLEFRGDAEYIYSGMFKYCAYKKILSDFRGNRASFNAAFQEAKRMEIGDNKSAITSKTNPEESMVAAIRSLMRTRGLTTEQAVIDRIEAVEKAQVANELRRKMINTIQSTIGFLEEYGFIDEYIEDSNAELEQLGLGKLKYIKRNPIPDQQYDENGKPVKDVEDIGVIDAFSKENLEQVSIEDLILMTTFWESKYFEKRMELSKAMTTIRTLDLWGAVLHDDDSVIENLDEEKVTAALKKDLGLTYLCRNKAKITDRMKKQYQVFLEEEGISSEDTLDDEIKEILPEVSNIQAATKDIAVLECLIVYLLKTKNMNIKQWGVIENNPDSESKTDQRSIALAIENRNFRGPLVMAVPEDILRSFWITEDLDFPKYEKPLDEKYCSIMSKLYLPTNKYFTNLVKKEYKENPGSPLLADLAGKKVKPIAPPAGEGR